MDCMCMLLTIIMRMHKKERQHNDGELSTAQLRSRCKDRQTKIHTQKKKQFG